MTEFLKEKLADPFGFAVLVACVMLGVILLMVMYAIYFERKISAWAQDRYGPNRVGPRGVLQPVADAIKFLLKEDITPGRVDRPLYVLAPCIIFVVALVTFAVIPWAGQLRWPWSQRALPVQVASLDIGLLYILAVASMGVYGVVLGGWASNNKYSFFGALRATAQLLSYEVPLGLAILVVVLTTGSLRLERIVEAQLQTTWNVLLHPLAFLLLMLTALAETNRLPFDLPEAEQELVGGYHTEYSSMKFALFFLGEYAHMITASALVIVLFFGGWQLVPFAGWLAGHVSWLGWLGWLDHSVHPAAAAARLGIMLGKTAAVIFLYMWIRWSLPRFRFDQLMRLAWRGLVPTGLALVAVAGGLVYFGRAVSWWAPGLNLALLLAGLVLLSRLGGPVTGRQADLPEVRVRPAAVPGD